MAAQDVGYIIVMLFALGLGFFVTNYMMNTAVDNIITNPVINQSNVTVGAFEGIKTEVTARLDYVFFGVFIGFILALIITSWFIGGHPIFMFLYFIFIIVMTAVSAILSNTWESFSSYGIFGTTVLSFPITNHILSYLPIYAASIGFIGIVVMFAKPALQMYD